MAVFSCMQDVNYYFSDMYKDAYGFRPRMDTTGWTLEDFNRVGEGLQSTIEDNIHWENIRRKENEKKFIALVRETRKLGAATNVDAVRWLIQGEHDGEYGYDVGYFLYGHGLSEYTSKVGRWVWATVKQWANETHEMSKLAYVHTNTGE